MVPRFSITSSRDMPTPLSRIDSVPAAGSGWISTASSPPPSSSGLPIARKRSRSQASEALEISSRRKISRLEYSEWIMRCSSWRTSAWNSRFSVWTVSVMVDSSFRPFWGGPRGFSRRSLRRQERQRVDRLAVLADLEMQQRLLLRPDAELGDRLPGGDQIAFAHEALAVVAVGREIRLVVLDDHELAVALEAGAAVDDAAGCGGDHRLAEIAGNVEALGPAFR